MPGCALQTFSKRVINSNGGIFSSLALTSQDAAVVAFHADEEDLLELYICESASCQAGRSVIVDNGISGWEPSLVINKQGNPVIAYYDRDAVDLKLAVCDDAQCSSATVRTVDTDVGLFLTINHSADIELTSSGVPIISYFHYAFNSGLKGSLKLAHCNDQTCSGA